MNLRLVPRGSQNALASTSWDETQPVVPIHPPEEYNWLFMLASLEMVCLRREVFHSLYTYLWREQPNTTEACLCGETAMHCSRETELWKVRSDRDVSQNGRLHRDSARCPLWNHGQVGLCWWTWFILSVLQIDCTRWESGPSQIPPTKTNDCKVKHTCLTYI
jgi:hypothetical protein